MDCYKLAGLVLSVDFGKLKSQRELEDFRIYDYSETPNIKATFQYVDSNPFMRYLETNVDTLVSTDILSIKEEFDSYVIFYKYPELIYGYRVFKQSTDICIYANDKETDEIDTVNIILDKDSTNHPGGAELFLYSLRDAFFFQALKFGRIPVHSASILYKDMVWLFSAPSGTGKSTHARMWKEAGISHTDFNGDVCIIYRDDEGTVMAGALPWCGTSKLYTNKDYPLGGVFFLKRGLENSVSELVDSDRVLKLVARTLTANWNRGLVSKIMDISENVEKDIVLAELTCNISKEAALCTQNYIDSKLELL